MILYDLAGVFTKIQFCATFLINSFLILLTVCYIKEVFGAYKRMVIYFAALGMIFSGLEVTARPYTHNYKASLLFFSVTTLNLPREVICLMISLWGGCWIVIVSFIAVQFVYRYLCLFKAQKIKKFEGVRSLLWLIYPVLPGVCYTVAMNFLCAADDYADDYVRALVTERYSLEISNLPRFPMLPYAADGSLRWKSLVYLPICIFLIGIHYIIIIYCCLRMHFSMKKELEKFSIQNQKLQRQFFHALIVQTLGPTIFLVIPASPILVLPLLAPIFGFDIDLQTGNLFAFVGFYPPFDSIAFMIIVKEYVKVIKKHVLCGLGTDNQVSAVEAFTQNVQS